MNEIPIPGGWPTAEKLLSGPQPQPEPDTDTAENTPGTKEAEEA